MHSALTQRQRATLGPAGEGWTEARTEFLRQQWANGETASVIARQLGGVTRNGIIGKAHRLGLDRRAPTRPALRPRKPYPVRESSPKLAAPKQTKPSPALKDVEATPAPVKRPLAPIVPALAPLLSAEGKPYRVLEIASGQCRYVLGDPRAEDWGFCARKTPCGQVYCVEHKRAATVQVRAA